MSRLTPGKYRARGRWARLAYTSKNDPQMCVELEILDEHCSGETIKWFGQFTEKTADRTLEALRLLGWDNDDLGNPTGIGSTDVEVDVAEEEYNGKWYTKARFINALGGGGATLRAPMDDAAAHDFARRMKGAAVASRQRMGNTTALQQANTAQARATAAVSGSRGNNAPRDAPPHTDDDIPF